MTAPTFPMQTIRLFLAVNILLLAGCADSPFDYANRDMMPLDGAGETPNIKNRFPASRGGLGLSRSDREDRDMTTLERLKQY